MAAGRRSAGLAVIRTKWNLEAGEFAAHRPLRPHSGGLTSARGCKLALVPAGIVRRSRFASAVRSWRRISRDKLGTRDTEHVISPESGIFRPIAVAGWLARHPTKVKPAIGQLVRHRRRSSFQLRLPWWPTEAINEVGSRIGPGSVVFEFGGGGSTLWLHDLGTRCTTVEHDAEWHKLLAEGLPPSTDIRLIEPSVQGEIASHGAYFDDYVNSIRVFEDESLDLVLIDGRARVACGLAATSKIRRGGMMVLDDSHRNHYQALAKALRGWDETHIYGLRFFPTLLSRVTVWTRL